MKPSVSHILPHRFGHDRYRYMVPILSLGEPGHRQGIHQVPRFQHSAWSVAGCAKHLGLLGPFQCSKFMCWMPLVASTYINFSKIISNLGLNIWGKPLWKMVWISQHAFQVHVRRCKRPWTWTVGNLAILFTMTHPLKQYSSVSTLYGIFFGEIIFME